MLCDETEPATIVMPEPELRLRLLSDYWGCRPTGTPLPPDIGNKTA